MSVEKTSRCRSCHLGDQSLDEAENIKIFVNFLFPLCTVLSLELKEICNQRHDFFRQNGVALVRKIQKLQRGEIWKSWMGQITVFALNVLQLVYGSHVFV